MPFPLVPRRTAALTILLSALLISSASAQEASFRKLDAEVWGTEQIIEGSLTGALAGVLYHNDVAHPFTAGAGTFSVPVSLIDGVNTFVACASDGSACSDTLRLTLAYKLRPEVYAHATVDGGTVRLHGEVLENPKGDDLTFTWRQDPDNPAPVTLTPSGSGATFNLPEDAPAGEYYFDLLAAGGDTARACTFVTVSEDGIEPFDIRNDHAAWVESAITYQVTPHSFQRGSGLKGVTRHIPELAELGINTLYLQPIFETDGGGQGYKITNFFKVRPDHGTEADLRELIATARRYRMKVLLDLVPNHSSIGHRYALHAIAHGDSSHYYDFYQRDVDRAEYAYAYNARHEGRMQFIYYFWYHLPNLNFDNPEVDRWMTEAARYWIEKFDVDGYRIDVAWGPRARDPQFFRDYRFTLKRLKPEILLIGEDKASDPRAFEVFDVAFDWYADPMWVSSWTWQTHLSPATNATIFLHPNERERAGLLRKSLAGQGLGWHPEAKVLRFMENNDLYRFAYHHGVQRSRMAAALLFSLPGVPLLYNGQEVGFHGADHAYRTRSLYTPAPIPEQDPDGLFPYYRHLIRLRTSLEALRSDHFEEVAVSPADAAGAVYAYRRWAGSQHVVGVINMGSKSVEASLALPAAEMGTEPGTTYYLNDLITGEALPVSGSRLGSASMEIPPHTTRLFALADTVANVRFDAPLMEPGEAPPRLILHQNYPDRFPAATSVVYELPEGGPARFTVLDVLGRTLAMPVDGFMPAGRHRVHIELGAFPVGTYYYQLHAGGKTLSRRMLVERPW